VDLVYGVALLYFVAYHMSLLGCASQRQETAGEQEDTISYTFVHLRKDTQNIY
jgi:hypothetical protein